MTSQLGVTAFFGVASVIGLYSWRRSRSAGGSVAIRRLYARGSLPIFMRNAVALVPFWSVGSLILAVTMVVPRWLGQWLSIAGLGAGFVAFVLSYRVPAPNLPAWLRDEIEGGRMPVARPDAGDWLLFALVVPLAVLAIPAVAVLIVVFQSGSVGM